MNRSRYIPFERNRYFYGKLLTVRDFMTEQTYFSDKGRLLNRLLFGSGVVSGLQVVAVDDKSISIETGVALDQQGREIVVPSPVTLKLSQLEGFTNNEYAKNVYLCIAYDEKGKEPVHTVAGSSGRDGDVSEHNRILESYRLSIREQAPAPSLQEYDHMIADTSIWYSDAQVRILQTVPRYIQPGQSFDLRLTIEKTLQTAHVEFEYEPDWSELEPAEELPGGKIQFSEPTDGGQTVYTRTIRVRALPLPPGETKALGGMAAKSGTARLVVGDRLIYDLAHVRHTIEISEVPAEQRILDAYYSRPLDHALESPSEPCVYLARISLLQMGATYVIDRVDSIPFDDYVINPTMLYRILMSQEGIGREVLETAGQQHGAEHEPAQALPFPDIKDEFLGLVDDDDEAVEEKAASGIAEISIMPLVKKKWYQKRVKDFYSEEIAHGLGAGPVFITAGLSDEQEETEVMLPEMWNRSDAVYYGEQSIFAKSEFASELPNVTVGFVYYPKKGTFRIGVRVHKKTERTRLRIRWWALKTADLQAEQGDSALEAGLAQQEAAAGRG